MITDVSIDPAGNVWAANNWNVVDAAMADENTARPTLTWGGGSTSPLSMVWRPR
jgi:hypothetical protein